MRLGLALPHYGYSIPSSTGNTRKNIERSSNSRLSWPSLLEVVRWAESAGFGSLWLSDHVELDLSKYGGGSESHPGFEYTSTLGAVSQVTRKAELGVLVACAVLRPPAVIARSAETIAQASGRKFWLGLGAGWYEPDFEAAGVSSSSASERLDHLADVAKSVGELLGPESSVTTIIGGKGGPKILSIAAQYADGWNISWAIDPQTLSAKAARFSDMWHTARPKGIGRIGPHISVGLTCLVAPDEKKLRRRFFEMFDDFGLASPKDPEKVFEEARIQRLVCTSAELPERIDQYRRAGACEIVCGFGPVPFSFWRKDIAEEFLHAARQGDLAVG